jgi:hypothetical protein
VALSRAVMAFRHGVLGEKEEEQAHDADKVVVNTGRDRAQSVLGLSITGIGRRSSTRALKRVELELAMRPATSFSLVASPLRRYFRDYNV